MFLEKWMKVKNKEVTTHTNINKSEVAEELGDAFGEKRILFLP